MRRGRSAIFVLTVLSIYLNLAVISTPICDSCANCGDVGAVFLDSNLTAIAPYAFYYCTSLESVEIGMYDENYTALINKYLMKYFLLIEDW